MNDRKQAILSFVEAFTREHGYSPTITEVCEGVGLSRASVHHHLLALRAEGKVTWALGMARTLRRVA